MELIPARCVTLQICILYKPENSVILLSTNLCLESRKTKGYLLHRVLRKQIFQQKSLGLERRWIRRKTKDYLLHRALRTQIFQQKSKVTSCNVCQCFNSLSTSKGGVSIFFFLNKAKIKNRFRMREVWQKLGIRLQPPKMGVGFESLWGLEEAEKWSGFETKLYYPW